MCLLTILIVFIVFVNSGGNLLDETSLEYKETTLLIYGKERRSDRDLPVCESKYEACNFAHHRLWLTPITERLCRCPRRAQCPFSYEIGDELRSQHVSNRAQLKFCEEFDESFMECKEGQTAAKLLNDSGVNSSNQQTPSKPLTRTTLFCKCAWPHMLILNHTSTKSPNRTIKTFSCNKLPRSSTNEACGYVRKDTYEVYYTRSCPENHLCLINIEREFQMVKLMHFEDEAFKAVCTKV